MRYESYENGATLCGFESIDPAERFADLTFPREAYVAWLRMRNLPLPEAWAHLDAEPQPAEIPEQADNAEMDSPPPSRAFEPEDGYEVVPGVSLGDLRALLDERNEGSTFRPLLLAAIKSAIGIAKMQEEVPEGSTFLHHYNKGVPTAETEIRRNELAALGCWDPLSKAHRVSKADMDRVEQVLRLARCKKNGAPLRTP